MKLNIVLPHQRPQGWKCQVLNFQVSIHPWAWFGEKIDMAIQGHFGVIS